MDQELLKKLLETFQIEAREHLAAISSGLVELERVSAADEQMEIIERVFREAHSLKGAARAVNRGNVEEICQSLESLFAQLKDRQIALAPELFDRLHRMVDKLDVQLSGQSAASADTRMVTNMEPPTKSGQRPAGMLPIEFEPERIGQHKPLSSETLRMSAVKLDTLLCQAEEFIPAKATAAQRISEVREISRVLDAWEAEWRKTRPHACASPALIQSDKQVTAFLDRNEHSLISVKQRIVLLGKRLEDDRRGFERKVDDLVENMQQVSMLPFSILLESFPKLVRDLSRDCGKDVELVVAGGEIAMDRRILEEMKDPLIHLVRNCIDHGIETPSERQRNGKVPRATVRIAIHPTSAITAEIVVTDDGAGIDLQKVRAASVKLRLVPEEDAKRMNEQQAAELIFKSGLSTSPMITEISGRGLGLAIVREKAEKVDGTVSVVTQRGVGTTFRLMLPLSLARFRGILVRVGGSLFVLPTRHVQTVLRVSQDEIKTVENRETIQIKDRMISAVRLSHVLGLPPPNTGVDAKGKVPVVVLIWASERIAFCVDEILHEQEVMVKSLGKQLPHVRNIAGATILATGRVLPVLDVADLMHSAVKLALAPVTRAVEEVARTILVAEDSITSRTLLKNILEMAGYKVKTAVDGVEALGMLTTEAFDLVVSDVEMPRMSGLDLTAKIRAGKRFSEIPVILVTALDSRQDRERGVEVGANAYIVKGSFDQGNLLEVVRRLI